MKKQNTSTPRSREAEQRGQAARIAAAEEAARIDKTRIAHWEQAVAMLSMVPPSVVGHALNTISVEGTVSFLKQIPELQDLMPYWSKHYFEYLKRLDLEKDIQRLEGLGVRRTLIAIAMIVIKFAPMFDHSFAQHGDKRERQQRVKRLLAPLPELSDLAKVFDDIPPLASQEMPNPSKIIAELKLLSSMYDWGEFVYDSLGANHLLEVAKFGLASLVHETTGKFLDGVVARLTAAALGSQKYDETGHRIWRINNYKRLQQSVPILTRVLVALNTVVSQPQEER